MTISELLQEIWCRLHLLKTRSIHIPYLANITLYDITTEDKFTSALPTEHNVTDIAHIYTSYNIISYTLGELGVAYLLTMILGNIAIH